MAESNSRVGLWDGWYKTRKYDRKIYDDSATAKIAGAWLNHSDIKQVEDWGCGYGGFKNYIGDEQQYIGVDGSQSKFADKIEDLTIYQSKADAIHLRHVLEHNIEWQKILDNFLASFQKKAVITLFTPFVDETKVIQVYPNWHKTGIDMVDTAFSLTELEAYFKRHNVKVVQTIFNIKSETIYKIEHMFLLEK